MSPPVVVSSTMGPSGGNIKVLARVRPALPHEYQHDQAVEAVSLTTVKISNAKQSYESSYDRVLVPGSSQELLYAQVKGCVNSLLDGYNNTILAYGQTGTGKTFSMVGDQRMTFGEACSIPCSASGHGIIPRAVYDLFTELDSRRQRRQAGSAAAGATGACAAGAAAASDCETKLVCSYFEIYNNQLYDLLQPYKKCGRRDPARIGGSKTCLEVRDDPIAGTHVPNLLFVDVQHCQQVLQLLAAGNRNRAVWHTDLNQHSSRSHAILQLWLEQRRAAAPAGAGSAVRVSPVAAADVVVRSKLNFVDLAGSERWGSAHSQSEDKAVVTELTSINSSLSALALVVSALTDKTAKHVPYRSSRLTHLLQDSLGGNCNTALLVTLAPCVNAFDDSLAPLKFADRARNIANRAVINSSRDPETILAVKEREIERLRALLATYTSGAGAASASAVSVAQTAAQQMSPPHLSFCGSFQAPADTLFAPYSSPGTPNWTSSTGSTGISSSVNGQIASPFPGPSGSSCSSPAAAPAGSVAAAAGGDFVLVGDATGAAAAAERAALEAELAATRAALALERSMRSALEGQLQEASAAALAQTQQQQQQQLQQMATAAVIQDKQSSASEVQTVEPLLEPFQLGVCEIPALNKHHGLVLPQTCSNCLDQHDSTCPNPAAAAVQAATSRIKQLPLQQQIEFHEKELRRRQQQQHQEHTQPQVQAAEGCLVGRQKKHQVQKPWVDNWQSDTATEQQQLHKTKQPQQKANSSGCDGSSGDAASSTPHAPAAGGSSRGVRGAARDAGCKGADGRVNKQQHSADHLRTSVDSAAAAYAPRGKWPHSPSATAAATKCLKRCGSGGSPPAGTKNNQFPASLIRGSGTSAAGFFTAREAGTGAAAAALAGNGTTSEVVMPLPRLIQSTSPGRSGVLNRGNRQAGATVSSTDSSRSSRDRGNKQHTSAMAHMGIAVTASSRKVSLIAPAVTAATGKLRGSQLQQPAALPHQHHQPAHKAAGALGNNRSASSASLHNISQPQATQQPGSPGGWGRSWLLQQVAQQENLQQNEQPQQQQQQQQNQQQQQQSWHLSGGEEPLQLSAVAPAGDVPAVADMPSRVISCVSRHPTSCESVSEVQEDKVARHQASFSTATAAMRRPVSAASSAAAVGGQSSSPTATVAVAATSDDDDGVKQPAGRLSHESSSGSNVPGCTPAATATESMPVENIAALSRQESSVCSCNALQEAVLEDSCNALDPAVGTGSAEAFLRSASPAGSAAVLQQQEGSGLQNDKETVIAAAEGAALADTADSQHELASAACMARTTSWDAQSKGPEAMTGAQAQQPQLLSDAVPSLDGTDCHGIADDATAVGSGNAVGGEEAAHDAVGAGSEVLDQLLNSRDSSHGNTIVPMVTAAAAGESAVAAAAAAELQPQGSAPTATPAIVCGEAELLLHSGSGEHVGCLQQQQQQQNWVVLHAAGEHETESALEDAVHFSEDEFDCPAEQQQQQPISRGASTSSVDEGN